MSGWRHGTTTGYKTYRCRCDDCKDAGHAYYMRHRDRIRAAGRAYHARNKARAADLQRAWRERVKRGEVVLPELDWAICERGGSEAQARAHRRRGQKPCPNCLGAEGRAHERRRAARAECARKASA